MAAEKYHFTYEDTEFEIPWMTGLKTGLKADLLEGFAEAETSPHKLYRAFFAIASKYAGREAEEALKDMEDEEFQNFSTSYIKGTPGISGK